MPEPFEIRTELDEGFRFVDGRPVHWTGARVRYRPLGSRGRFASFLLDFDRPPGTAELQAACAAHEARKARG